MSSQTTVIITGANRYIAPPTPPHYFMNRTHLTSSRGIGAAILHALSTSPPASLTPLTILACARSPPSSPPPTTSNSAQVHWHALDISSHQSITTFAETVRTDLAPSGVDILISNAGVNLDLDGKQGIEPAEKTLATNFTGTLGMMQTFAPLMRRPGLDGLGGRSRIVNLSSVGGKLSSGPYGKEIAARLKGAGKVEDVEQLGREYLEAVRTKSEKNKGWPVGKNYSVSKALLNAATEVVARDNEGVLVNFCCPGWCDSDMGRLIGQPGKSNAEGARIPLKLAVGDIGDVSGKYFENESVHGKGSGKISEW